MVEPKQTIEQLEAALKELEISTEYIDVANALSYELLRRHRVTEQAYALAKECYALCSGQFSAYRKGLAEALINLALYLTIQSDIQTALRHILLAGTICEELKDIDVLFKQLNIQSFVFSQMANYAEAIAVNLKRVKLAQEQKRPYDELIAYEKLAVHSSQTNEHDQALVYYNKAYAIAQRLDDKKMLAHIQMNRTQPLRFLGQYDLAKQDAEAAYTFYQGQMNSSEAISIGILGYIYLELETYEQAMGYFRQKLEIVEKLNSNYLKAYTYCEIGRVHLAAGRSAKALEWLESGVQLAESHGSNTTLLQAYPYLVQAYKENQEFEKALAIFEKMTKLSSEVSSAKATNHRNALLVMHETEQARLEAKLQQERADRLKARNEHLTFQNALFKKLDTLKDEMMSTASHDIRNPLAAIKLDTDLLTIVTSGNKKADKYLKRLNQSINHMTHLIDDLLDFSNIHQQLQPELEYCDLVKIIKEPLTRYASSIKMKKIDLQVNFPADPIIVELDPHQMDRVFDNLINNAIKYSTKGSVITLALQEAKDKVIFSISDTGRGIPEDEVPNIFKRGFRASNSRGEAGEGSGLAIVYSILSSHQGSIFCDSVEGRGSTFTIHLAKTVDAK